MYDHVKIYESYGDNDTTVYIYIIDFLLRIIKNVINWYCKIVKIIKWKRKEFIDLIEGNI